MTERKPPGASWESWVDQQIREGIERGQFDRLAGTGKPLAGLDGTGDVVRDEDWWVKEKLKREEVSFLPPALAVRKELDEARVKIDAAILEHTVRKIVAEINDRIREVNRGTISGPPSTLMPLDVEQTVINWRTRRDAAR